MRWQQKQFNVTKENTNANHHTTYSAKSKEEFGFSAILLKFCQDTPETGDRGYLLTYRYIDWKDTNSIKIVAIFG